MTTNRRRYKYLIFFVWTLTVVTILDFSPMLYQRLFGNGGTFVKHYHFDITGDSLLNKLTTIDRRIKFKVSPTDNSGYSYIQVFEKNYNEYFHLWVRTNQQFSNGSEIVFYGVSNSPDYKDCKIINRDYDFIFNKLTIAKFERLILNKLYK